MDTKKTDSQEVEKKEDKKLKELREKLLIKKENGISWTT